MGLGVTAVLALGGCSPDAGTPEPAERPGAPPGAYIGREKALALYDEWVKRLDLRIGDDVFPCVGDVPTTCGDVETGDPDMLDAYELDGRVLMTLEACTGDPIFIRNGVLGERLKALKEPFAGMPTWTTEMAQSKAEEFLKRIRGELPRGLRHAGTEFLREGLYLGVWEVWWRTTCDGYPVDDGNMGVLLHEEFGLLRYVGRPLHLPSSTEVLVSKEDTLLKSLEYQRQGLQNPDEFNEGCRMDESILKAELRVVRPNYRYHRSTVDGKTVWGRKHSRVLRLAWAIQRKTIGPKGGSSMKMEAWIDAATGEPLGAAEYVYP